VIVPRTLFYMTSNPLPLPVAPLKL